MLPIQLKPKSQKTVGIKYEKVISFIKEIPLKVLREHIAYVPQDNYMFSDSLENNIKFGKLDASHDEVVQACKDACVHDNIIDFPMQYETVVGERGVTLSGGQKQRLCIARALLKNPKILILDDSTSAVDTATDASIQESFNERIPDTTKIIISQRISSVQNASRIIVLNDGVVDGFDTHDKLLETNEIYRTIYETQMKGKEEE